MNIDEAIEKEDRYVRHLIKRGRKVPRASVERLALLRFVQAWDEWMYGGTSVTTDDMHKLRTAVDEALG